MRESSGKEEKWWWATLKGRRPASLTSTAGKHATAIFRVIITLITTATNTTMDTSTPTIPARKQAFLAAQTTLLSQPVTPSRAWRATNDASNAPIRRRLVEDAVFEFNRIVGEHCKRAYAPQSSRNLAERISTIYIGQMDRRQGGTNDVDGGVGKEVDLSESHANATPIAITDYDNVPLLKPTVIRLSHSRFPGRWRKKPQPNLRMRRPMRGPSPALSNSASSDNKFSSAWKSSAG